MVCFLVFLRVVCLGGIDMREKKTILLIQPLYSIVIHYIIALTSLFGMFLPIVLSWNNAGWMKVVWNFILSLFLVYGFVQGFLHIQFAEVDKEKIAIKNLFHLIAIVKWTEISSVKKEKILTYDSRGYIYLDWIVLRTNDTQEIPYRVKLNRKGMFPLLIVANKKNCSIIAKYSINE